MHVRRPPSSSAAKRPGRRSAWLLVPAVALLLAGLGSCGGKSEPATPSPTATTSSTPSASPTASASPSSSTTLQLSVYFISSGKIAAGHRTVPKTKAVAAAAVNQLLDGPTDAESSAGFTNALPPGASVRSIRVAKGTALVSLDAEILQLGQSNPEAEAAALAQLTFTLTQFPTVGGVEFWSGDARIAHVDGSSVDFTKPVNRADFENLTPAILIESPCVGDGVRPPLVVSGSANTFEATFKVELLDGGGGTLARQTVTATSGSGTRGTFQASIPYSTSAGNGTLVAFEVSQETGLRIHEVRVPLSFTP
jgi:germination protein M